MAESLNVIALVSGGKDSFFSILHCIQNGHKIVALGNLYPAPTSGPGYRENHGEADSDDEHDLNSFMYQTVGHTVIPLYEQALQIPLYRQPIIGTAIQTSLSYNHVDELTNNGTSKSGPESDETEDETESLIPLLKKIIAKHPTANAISTGAILSTYQRTRVESVALRLGLTPLGFLWQYPILPPAAQASLLEDMQSVRLDARIVKVASGGLDESFLWQNVASRPVMSRLEKSMKRFGTDGDGAVLGEGGEFETLLIDGPLSLFKGRIEIEEEDKRIVREGGGAAWLRISKAKVVMKTSEISEKIECRIPTLLRQRFSDVLNILKSDEQSAPTGSQALPAKAIPISTGQVLSQPKSKGERLLHWTFGSEVKRPELAIVEEATSIISDIKQHLNNASLEASDIVSTVILLRSMADFAAINQIYGSLFTAPNPPSRVTISSGDLLPASTNLIIHLTLHILSPQTPPKKALHVQSRSYWAPANIGPYSQAISIPSPTSDIWTISIAGQIPLIPHTMTLPPANDFNLQAVLSLQHLWRIGEEMNVSWWTSVVAYLPRSSADTNAERAVLAGRAWELLHVKQKDEDEEDEENDLWEEKHFAGMEQRGAADVRKELPDWEVVKGEVTAPPFWAVEVEELPRGAGVEWHAHLGVVSGPVEVYAISRGAGWTIHQCGFVGRLRSVVMIDYSSHSSDLSKALESGLEALGLDSDLSIKEHASYVDVSVNWSRSFNGAIPCKAIWDISGNKLALVLLFDS